MSTPNTRGAPGSPERRGYPSLASPPHGTAAVDLAAAPSAGRARAVVQAALAGAPKAVVFVRIVNRRDGRPVPNVTVVLCESGGREVGRARSDRGGVVRHLVLAAGPYRAAFPDPLVRAEPAAITARALAQATQPTDVPVDLVTGIEVVFEGAGDLGQRSGQVVARDAATGDVRAEAPLSTGRREGGRLIFVLEVEEAGAYHLSYRLDERYAGRMEFLVRAGIERPALLPVTICEEVRVEADRITRVEARRPVIQLEDWTGRVAPLWCCAFFIRTPGGERLEPFLTDERGRLCVGPDLADASGTVGGRIGAAGGQTPAFVALAPGTHRVFFGNTYYCPLDDEMVEGLELGDAIDEVEVDASGTITVRLPQSGATKRCRAAYDKVHDAFLRSIASYCDAEAAGRSGRVVNRARTLTEPWCNKASAKLRSLLTLAGARVDQRLGFSGQHSFVRQGDVFLDPTVGQLFSLVGDPPAVREHLMAQLPPSIRTHGLIATAAEIEWFFAHFAVTAGGGSEGAREGIGFGKKYLDATKVEDVQPEDDVSALARWAVAFHQDDLAYARHRDVQRLQRFEAAFDQIRAWAERPGAAESDLDRARAELSRALQRELAPLLDSPR